MVLEAAVLYVLPGREQDFEADFKIAGQYISSIPGYIKHSLQKCLEQNGKYLLLVEWESLEAMEETADSVDIFSRDGGGVIVRNRAFISEFDRIRFIELIRSSLAESRS